MRPDTTAPKVEWAVWHAEQGRPVFPLAENSKVPMKGVRFPELATTDLATIEAWWQQWPDANIGMYTGDTLLVVDVDDKNGKRGSDEVTRLDLEGFELAATTTQTTATGGRHLIYEVDAPVSGGTNKLAPGVDIKSAGGYIVAAGSTIDGKQYSIDDAPTAPAPAWLIARCSKPRDKAPAANAPAIEAPSAERNVTHYLQNEAPLAIEGQAGDATTFKVACRVRDYGATEGQCFALMAQHWNERCSPPWSQLDLMDKVRNAYRYGTEAQGSAAPESDFKPLPIEAQPVATPATPSPFSLTRGRVNLDLRIKPPPRDFVLPGLLLAGKPGVLAGFGGTYKTSILLQMAVCVALGLPFMGADACSPGAALLVLGEEDADEVNRRLGSISEALALNETQIATLRARLLVFPAVGDDVRFTRKSGGGAIPTGNRALVEAACAAFAVECGLSVRLIGLDHLALFSGGEPNDTSDATIYTREVAHLAHATRAGVWTLAHSPKSAAGKAEKDQHDVRGSSAIVDNSRLVVAMAGMSEAQAKQFGLSDEQRHDYSEMRITKSNYTKRGRVCWMRSTFNPAWEATALSRVELEPVKKAASDRVASVSDRIIDAVKDSPGRYSPTGLSERFAGKWANAGRPVLKAAIDALVASGHLMLRKPSPAELETYGLMPGKVRSTLDIGPQGLPANQYEAPR